MARVLEEPRSYAPRNVHLYNDAGQYLGGLYADPNSPHVTKANIYQMSELYLDFHSAQWAIYRLDEDGSTGEKIPRTRSPVREGRYVILDHQRQGIPVDLIDETPVRRVVTHQPSTQRLSRTQVHFRNELRRRDGACAISGVQGIFNDPFLFLQAAHVYPVARQSTWERNNYMQWITDTTPASRIGSNKLYSIQNGLLLSQNVHSLFDGFDISVNVDDGYKVTCFSNDPLGIGGRTLSQTATNPANANDRVSDRVLRWHFRQAVLTHMKAAGQSPLEHDFDGEDDVAQIMEDPHGAEIMELELFTRLGPYTTTQDLPSSSDSEN